MPSPACRTCGNAIVSKDRRTECNPCRFRRLKGVEPCACGSPKTPGFSSCRACHDDLPEANRPSITQWAWIAGICEAEATFTFKNPRSPFVRVQMTDCDVIQQLHAIAGVGRVVEIARRRDHHKRSWAWTVQAKRHLPWLLTGVTPFLHERRRAAAMKQWRVVASGQPFPERAHQEITWAWVAGFLEGEMHLSVQRSGKRVGKIRGISVTSIDHDVLASLQGAVGGIGHFRDIPPRKPTHRPSSAWEVHSHQDVLTVLSGVRPYLMERRGRLADEVIGRLAEGARVERARV